LAEQVTLNHSVRGSSPWRLTFQNRGDGAGAIQMKPNVTLVSWAFAPEWLTVEEASALSGHDLSALDWLIKDGALDTRCEGDIWLIEKASLREFQEALLLVLQMGEDADP
jgi:hypothetical protein